MTLSVSAVRAAPSTFATWRVRLLAGSMLVALPVLLAPYTTHAQTSQTHTYLIAAQPLSGALVRFSTLTGIDLVFDGAIPGGVASPGVQGTLPPADAIAKLLSGTGLSFRFIGSDTIAIINPAVAEIGTPIADDGSLVLETINVTGAGVSSVYSPYETASPSSFISAESIERFRGSSPADIFRGTPGVMSGEARNGAGSIDVNIRGMQGFGRVTTTVDDAENSVAIAQSYQGVSNRTFVDPDFIAGVDITRGADASSWGNAGSVAMRTVRAEDIVKPGDTWGVRVKGGFGTNTSTPVAGSMSGFGDPNWNGVSGNSWGRDSLPSPAGMDRPGFLAPTSGSGSIVAALSEENYDLLVGYAHRKQGNYHAGTVGPAAELVVESVNPERCVPIVPGRPQYGEICTPASTLYDNAGIANYRAGEEVLNTELETQSWLAKGTVRFDEGHSLQFGYTGFRSEAGDKIASRLVTNKSRASQQAQTTGTSVDTFNARYLWDPSDNDLINLKATAYWTHLELRNPARILTSVKPETIGLPAGYRVGSDTDMWGADISNLSKFTLDAGDLDLSYGVSYRGEDYRPSAFALAMDGNSNGRNALRQELAGFAKATWKPRDIDWLTVNAGLRYSHLRTEDRTIPGDTILTYNKSTSGSGLSPSVGVIIEPAAGAQLYANYSSMLRQPSVWETTNVFGPSMNADVRPERSNNFELGGNFNVDGLLAENDRAMLKLGYFNWDVKDYLAREWDPANYTLTTSNIHGARFAGLELSGRYELDGFSADLSANYFLNVEYCRTADTCGSKTLYGDYATNHVPPEYTVDLTLSQKLLDDRLTVGGRLSYVGPRAVGHGDVTGQGAQEFITPVFWRPYALVDVFGEYRINDNLTASIRVENLFDQFYVDPLGLVTQPGPGRTFYASLTGNFGGAHPIPHFNQPFFGVVDSAKRPANWSGLYAGIHAGGGFGRTWGRTTALDGSSDAVSASESVDLRHAGGLFGVQAGYNHQFANRVILGAEADWSATWMSNQHNAFAVEGHSAGTGRLQAEIGYAVDWTASVRARLGYAVSDRMMAYATGGVSFLQESLSRTQYRADMGGSQIPYGTRVNPAATEVLTGTRAGITVGGGAEYALNDRWSIKADYTYSHFAAKDWAFRHARAGIGVDYYDQDELVTGSSSIVNGRKAANTFDLHSLKVGLNYRF